MKTYKLLENFGVWNKGDEITSDVLVSHLTQKLLNRRLMLSFGIIEEVREDNHTVDTDSESKWKVPMDNREYKIVYYKKGKLVVEDMEDSSDDHVPYVGEKIERPELLSDYSLDRLITINKAYIKLRDYCLSLESKLAQARREAIDEAIASVGGERKYNYMPVDSDAWEEVEGFNSVYNLAVDTISSKLKELLCQK
jgi:hypothetical protein